MTPEYFKHHLRPYEAEAYMKGIFIGQRAGWEQARLIVSPWRDGNGKPMVFPWEEDEQPKAPTRDEIERAREWAAQAVEILNKKKN
jgi:hypothetical protein